MTLLTYMMTSHNMYFSHDFYLFIYLGSNKNGFYYSRPRLNQGYKEKKNLCCERMMNFSINESV